MPTPKKAAKKKTKKIPAKYKNKFVVNGTFEEIMKKLVTPSGVLSVSPTKKDKHTLKR